MAPSTMPRRAILFLPLLAAVLLGYSNHFHNSFHFDDVHTIVENPAVRSLSNVPRFFSDASLFSVLPANRTWRPILSTTLAVDYAIAGGYHPLWFHIDSFFWFLLQLFCMQGLFFALLNTQCPESSQRNWLIALGATALYALHPAIAETVNYIIQRGDILSTLGVIAALLLYTSLPTARRFGLYLVPLVLGLMAKPPALVLPLLLASWLLLFESRTRVSILLALLPSTAATVAILYLESRLTPHSYTPGTLSPAAYLITQPYVALRYFSAFFLPIHLNVDTNLQPVAASSPQALAGFLFLAASLTLIVVCCRRTALRPIAFGLIWFLVALLPTSLYPLAELENDHRMYMPFVGLSLAVTYALALAAERLRQRRSTWFPHLSTGAALLCLTGYAYGTHRRNAVWHTEETLWADDVAKSPHNGRGLMMYGLTQMQKNNLPLALQLFQQAQRYTPNYPTLEINLGLCLAALGDATSAEQHLLRAIQLAPTDDLPHLYYGRFLVEHNRPADAAIQLRTAIALNPARSEPHTLLAIAESRLQQFKPGSAEDWLNRSLTEYQHGAYSDSIADARQALALRRDYAEAWNNIGAAEAALGHWQAAIQADTTALHLRPDFPLARNNLAWAIRQSRGTQPSAVAQPIR